ncbi:MAG: hypothetical protein ACKN9E_04860 [Microcystaceae cyanobacterium]
MSDFLAYSSWQRLHRPLGQLLRALQNHLRSLWPRPQSSAPRSRTSRRR